MSYDDYDDDGSGGGDSGDYMMIVMMRMLMMNNGDEVEDEDEDEYDNDEDDGDDDWKVDERLNFETGDYELKFTIYILSGFASSKIKHVHARSFVANNASHFM